MIYLFFGIYHRLNFSKHLNNKIRLSTKGSTFSNIYIPGIALLPYRFKYSGIGKYMIKKSILQFLRVYQENLNYRLTIYSIATSIFGSIFLKDYYRFTLAAGEKNVFYKVFTQKNFLKILSKIIQHNKYLDTCYI